MNFEKRESLSPLLESANQVHLTIYLENWGDDLGGLKRRLEGCLKSARESLEDALEPEQREALLAPVVALLEDGSVLRQLRGHVGIFRTRASFRVLSLPVDVKTSCHVATTFHVKPLLRWMQWDSDFVLLGLDRRSAHLYCGNQETLRKVDTILYPNRLAALLEVDGPMSPPDLRELKEESRRAFSWMGDWIAESVPRGWGRLFVAGEDQVVRPFMKLRGRRRMTRVAGVQRFEEEQVHEIAGDIRAALRARARMSLEQAILTFRVAEQMNFAEKSLRKIAMAAIQGRVKKLIVAENREIFGKLDPRTGRLAIHPFDRDHEDDDLLDDLAQRVLIAGGEVYLARKEEIPDGRPILAILKNEEGGASA